MKWRKVTTMPYQRRIMIAQDGRAPNDEMAIAWRDRIDGKLYYAPNGGVVTWEPTHWASLPDGPSPRLED